jgi:hypothetical protein
MARRSILSPVRDDQYSSSGPFTQTETVTPTEIVRVPRTARISSRHAKLHVGGYFEPGDPIVMSFQKLRVDLRRSQQDMLLEALRDFVAKQEAARAFR